MREPLAEDIEFVYEYFLDIPCAGNFNPSTMYVSSRWPSMEDWFALVTRVYQNTEFPCKV